MACTRQGAEVRSLRDRSLRRALQVKPSVERIAVPAPSTAELVDEIRAAFPGGEPLKDNEISTCPCSECAVIRTDFADCRRWELPAAKIEEHQSSLPLLSAVAYQQFLPAYMVQGLESPHHPWSWGNQVIQFIMIGLLPDERDAHWRERFEGFTPSQWRTLRRFVEYVVANDDYYQIDSSEGIKSWLDTQP